MEPVTWTDQRTPALAIVARGDQIEDHGDHYTVRSQSRPDHAYAIRRTGSVWACTCDHNLKTRLACIHVLAVRFRNDLRAGNTEVITTPACPRCDSASAVRNGKRHNDNGAVQLHKCNECHHRFTDREGFEKRHADAGKIALALDLYFRGLSLRKVAEHFRQAHDLRVSHMTVHRWVAHYSALAARWMDAQGARTGDRWHVDETVVNVDGAGRYLWNVMDADTRFLLATHVSRDRSIATARVPLSKAKAATPDRPKEVFTDGMTSYPDAVGRELGHRGGPGTNGYWTPHHRVPSIRAPESNNRVERLHGTEKERVKTMRAFDNEKGAAATMEGFRVHYNMVREHQAIGKTPAEAAGLKPLRGAKWCAVLRMAVQS